MYYNHFKNREFHMYTPQKPKIQIEIEKKYPYTIIPNIYAESQYTRTKEVYFFIHLYNVWKTGTF